MAPTDAPYRDPARPTPERVDDLLARMTPDEKLAQLGSAWAFSVMDGAAAMADEAVRVPPQAADRYLRHGLGHLTRAGGSTNLLPAQTARLTNAVQRYLVEETRLGVPAVVHEECCSGYMARGATVYPQALGLAATWRPELAEQIAGEVRRQMRAVGAHQALAPVLDVCRDPRWGRVEETFGECPRLVSDVGAAFVRGLQEGGAEGVVATAKHFLGYGASEGGMNWAPAHVPARELREVYAAPFAHAVRAGLGSVMNAYHELDGLPCGADEALLTGLLRDEIGFEGVVVGDYFAVQMLEEYHGLTRGKAESAALALRAGIDVELPATDCYGDPLRQALAEGLVDQALLDRAVRRVLTQKIELGLFERPYVDEGAVAAVFDDPGPLATAQEVAEASFVLLTNGGGVLPLSRAVGSVAVVGPNAASARALVGDYSYPAALDALLDPATLGSDGVALPPWLGQTDLFADMPSVLDGIREAAPDATIRYAPGCDVTGDDRSGFEAAVEAARQSDVAVVVCGGRSGLTDDCTCGEARDRADIGLPGVQADFVRAVAATGTPTALVLIGGRPYALDGVVEHVAAVLHGWLPGEAGGAAVARTLFGDGAPGGKLPISVPRSAGQIPIFYNHKPSGGRSHWKGDYVDLPSAPLFAFGHGLSYTTFRLSDLRLAEGAVEPDGVVAIRVTVENTGGRDGDETVQVYARPEAASLTRPVKQLVGYRRVSVPAGAAAEVEVVVPTRRFGFVGRDLRFVVEPGPVRLWVGTASDDTPLEATVEVVRQPVAA